MIFAFLESEKEVNITRALEMCKTLLKDQENTPNVIVIDRGTTLMNSFAKGVSYILHITLSI